MTINIACGSAEVTGFAEVKDVNITFSFEAEETGAVVKQFLPAIRELKEFGIFQTQKDNDKLCEELNQAREEKREIERERDRARETSDFMVKKVNEQLQEKDDEITKLKDQLEEARAIAKAKINK